MDKNLNSVGVLNSRSHCSRESSWIGKYIWITFLEYSRERGIKIWKSIKEREKEQDLAQSLAHYGLCVKSSWPPAFNKLSFNGTTQIWLCVAYGFFHNTIELCIGDKDHMASMPRKSYGQRNLMGYSPWGCKRVRHDLASKW